jgi:hypothetical protein
MDTTYCKKCIFYSEDEWCEFGIPESITNDSIIIDSINHTIHPYSCSYAFGSETLEKNQQSINKEQIKEIILRNNQIHYTLVLNFDTLNKSVQTIIDSINNASFKPKNVVCFGKTIEGDMVASFEKHLSVPWKASKILPHIDEPISIISCVDVLLDKYDSKGFLYVSNQDTLDNLEDIMNNAHIDMVIDQKYAIRLSSLTNLDGLFMTYDTYKILGSDKPKFFYETALFFQDNPSCPYLIYK